MPAAPSFRARSAAFRSRATGAAPSCPLSAPAFVLNGGMSENAFSLPISMAFRPGQLTNLSVVNGRFANGESLEVTTTEPPTRRSPRLHRTRTHARRSVPHQRTGNGTLTITSTGAQYASPTGSSRHVDLATAALELSGS